MQVIKYERSWDGFLTRCPNGKHIMVGSHACFFCKFCTGRTEEDVRCTFDDSIPHHFRPKNEVSIDVMVNGEFRRTIRVKPTGFQVEEGNLKLVLTDTDIDRAVATKCLLFTTTRNGLLNLTIKNMEDTMNTFWNFLTGKFGKYRLKQPYRKYWQLAMIVIHAILIMYFVVFPMYRCIDWVVLNINRIIWG